MKILGFIPFALVACFGIVAHAQSAPQQILAGSRSSQGTQSDEGWGFVLDLRGSNALNLTTMTISVMPPVGATANVTSNFTVELYTVRPSYLVPSPDSIAQARQTWTSEIPVGRYIDISVKLGEDFLLLPALAREWALVVRPSVELAVRQFIGMPSSGLSTAVRVSRCSALNQTGTWQMRSSFMQWMGLEGFATTPPANPVPTATATASAVPPTPAPSSVPRPNTLLDNTGNLTHRAFSVKQMMSEYSVKLDRSRDTAGYLLQVRRPAIVTLNGIWVRMQVDRTRALHGVGATSRLYVALYTSTSSGSSTSSRLDGRSLTVALPTSDEFPEYRYLSFDPPMQLSTSSSSSWSTHDYWMLAVGNEQSSSYDIHWVGNDPREKPLPGWGVAGEVTVSRWFIADLSSTKMSLRMISTDRTSTPKYGAILVGGEWVSNAPSPSSTPSPSPTPSVTPSSRPRGGSGSGSSSQSDVVYIRSSLVVPNRVASTIYQSRLQGMVRRAINKGRTTQVIGSDSQIIIHFPVARPSASSTPMSRGSGGGSTGAADEISAACSTWLAQLGGRQPSSTEPEQSLLRRAWHAIVSASPASVLHDRATIHCGRCLDIFELRAIDYGKLVVHQHSPHGGGVSQCSGFV